MENIFLLVIIAVLLLYFYSSTNVHKSLYIRVKEEKDILNNELEKYRKLVSKYENQVNASGNALKDNQDNLRVARADLQTEKMKNSELKHKVTVLEARTEELYAQVNTMV